MSESVESTLVHLTMITNGNQGYKNDNIYCLYFKKL